MIFQGQRDLILTPKSHQPKMSSRFVSAGSFAVEAGTALPTALPPANPPYRQPTRLVARYIANNTANYTAWSPTTSPARYTASCTACTALSVSYPPCAMPTKYPTTQPTGCVPVLSRWRRWPSSNSHQLYLALAWASTVSLSYEVCTYTTYFIQIRRTQPVQCM